ncbi:MAG: sodium/solute symporter [Verrucomicrobiota bacterium]
MYLISAALIYTDSEQRSAFLEQIHAYAKNGTPEEKYEAFMALARFGSAADLGIFENQLKPTGASPGQYEAASADLRTAAANAILRLERRATHPLHPLDWGVIVLYLLGMLAIGFYYSLKTKTADDYLLGGRRMNPWAVGLSLFATLLSTISYLSYPGEMIRYGPMILAGYLATPFVYFIAGWFLIPYIMKLKVTSAYEILELRLGGNVRVLAASLFLAMRLVWMGVIVYTTTDTVLIPLMGINPVYSPLVAAVLGVITLIYTSMGGMKGVVVTDVVQTFILFAGALLSVILITVALGGVSHWWPTSWDPGWAPPRFWFDSTSRITFVGAMMNIFLWWICTCGSDQMAIQRYLSTRDVKAARRTLAVTLTSDFIVTFFLATLGFALLAYFRAKPHLLVDGQNLASNADQLFPRFIAIGLPLGISGLAVAGLLAAGMSSLSSGISSTSTVIKVDFFDRYRRGPTQRDSEVRRARVISIVIGIFTVLISALVHRVPGNLTETVNKLSGLFVAPLFLLFFMAIFVPWATPFGTIVGTLCSVAVAVAIAFFGLFGLSFIWIMPGALGVGMIVASAASLLPIGRNIKKPPLVSE